MTENTAFQGNLGGHFVLHGRCAINHETEHREAGDGIQVSVFAPAPGQARVQIHSVALT